MNTWTEVRYKIDRTRKEYAIDLGGNICLSLKEVFNSKEENIYCYAKLEKGTELLAERHYSPKNRQIVIDELTNIAKRNNPTGYDAITGKPLY